MKTIPKSIPFTRFNLRGLNPGNEFLGCPSCGFRLNPGEAAKPECPICRGVMLIYTVPKIDYPDLIHTLEIKIAANEEAATRSPQCADWSNGVAAGLRIALELLTLGPENSR